MGWVVKQRETGNEQKNVVAFGDQKKKKKKSLGRKGNVPRDWIRRRRGKRGRNHTAPR